MHLELYWVFESIEDKAAPASLSAKITKASASGDRSCRICVYNLIASHLCKPS